MKPASRLYTHLWLAFFCMTLASVLVRISVPQPLHWLAWQTRCTALFIGREDAWGQSYIIARGHQSSVLPDDKMLSVSPMPVAGYRQRMDRLLADIRSDAFCSATLARLAKHMEQNGQLEPTSELSIWRASWKTHEPSMAHPETRWVLPAFSSLPRERLKLVGCYRKVGTSWNTVAHKEAVQDLPRTVGEPIRRLGQVPAPTGQPYALPAAARRPKVTTLPKSPPLSKTKP
jgi:hypothetical protein